MMGEFKFEINKMIEIAKEMGIEVELNSDTPGIFVVDENGNEKEIEIEDLFPELKYLETFDENDE
jgi:histidinol phosphatase-like PHP family hydrolase